MRIPLLCLLGLHRWSSVTAWPWQIRCTRCKAYTPEFRHMLKHDPLWQPYQDGYTRDQ